ncbi:hypothetical protein BLNAU_10431 [Blattamonas nauphoetae]|uniref:Uncharacterized protein n=1 Tax=Blattamonas nauphoetae TaxID=2049346 RepID=A0ABQ9XT39_9EUKA|nr:hypothetical protein BLNAU_10431 [Blattamonas nauphoetae]
MDEYVDNLLSQLPPNCPPPSVALINLRGALQWSRGVLSVLSSNPPLCTQFVHLVSLNPSYEQAQNIVTSFQTTGIHIQNRRFILIEKDPNTMSYSFLSPEQSAEQQSSQLNHSPQSHPLRLFVGKFRVGILIVLGEPQNDNEEALRTFFLTILGSLRQR